MLAATSGLPLHWRRALVVAAPGRDWRYSGGGYTLGQLVVERAAGEPYSRVVERPVLRLLRMARTGFY